jgi:hypothetical protein
MKFTLKFEEYIRESESFEEKMYWFVVSEGEIVGVYDNPKEAKSLYSFLIEEKKKDSFDDYLDYLESEGIRTMDSYVHSQSIYPPELTVSMEDEEYDDYIQSQFEDKIFIDGPIKLSNIPNDILPLMHDDILNDIQEYGVFEL